MRKHIIIGKPGFKKSLKVDLDKKQPDRDDQHLNIQGD